MRFAIVGAVTLVVLVIGAISAWATATATKGEWYMGPMGSKGSETSTMVGTSGLTAEIGENPIVGKGFKFKTEIFEVILEIQASTVSCVECSITNERAGFSGIATTGGKLSFGGVGVIRPAHCRITGGTFVSNPLRFEDNYAEGETWLAKIVPESGETVFGIQIESDGSGTFCPFNGKIPVKGNEFASFTGPMGTFGAEQRLNFSQATSTKAGSAWTVNGKPFEATGTAILKAFGKTFGVK